MKTYLVTGSSGFVGWKTSLELLARGHAVVGIDNMNDYYDVRLKKHRLEDLLNRPGFVFHEADIEDMDAIAPVFEEHDLAAVINLAARAGVRFSIENPHVYMTTNAHGTLNLLELMRKHDLRKMVLASTSSLYAGQQMPFSESLPVNEPISPYAASKKAAEVMAYTYHYLFQMDITVLRYFTVYGPAGRPDMCVFRFIKWIDEGLPVELFGDGTQSRDFTYVDDIAHGTILAAETDVGYDIINLGGGRSPTSINDLIALIEKHLGKKAVINNKPFHKADMMETWADISKADRILNWSPTVSFQEGVRQSIAWYEQNRDWVKDVAL